MKITIEMNGTDLETFLRNRDQLLRKIDELQRTPAIGSAEERSNKILDSITSLTPDQKEKLRELIKANILG